MHGRAMMGLLTVAALGACRAADDVPGEVDAVLEASTAMPSLREVRWPATADNSPRSAGARVAVSPAGQVAFTHDGTAVLIVDTTGNLVAAVGRSGEGPGELRAASPIELTSNSIHVFDMSQLKSASYNLPSGKFEQEARFTVPVVPRARAGSRGYFVLSGSESGTIVGILPDGGTTVAPLIANADTTLSVLFPTEPDGKRTQPTVRLWQGGVVIANGKTYRIGLYDWEGQLVRVLSRDLEPVFPTESDAEARSKSLGTYRGPNGQRLDPAVVNKQSEEFKSKPVPYFTHTTALHSDARHRIWILGSSGDSTFADVFSTTGFLGRLALECDGFKNGWSLSGDWLALVCAAGADAPDVDAVIRLYRIAEPGN